MLAIVVCLAVPVTSSARTVSRVSVIPVTKLEQLMKDQTVSR